MERKNQRVNLGQVIAIPVLEGKNDKYMWTGLVKADKITNHMIRNDREREAFIKKVRDVEQSVAKYRSLKRTANSVLTVKPGESLAELEKHISKVCGEIINVINNPKSIEMDMDLFWVALCREYEEIKQKNPNEFSTMSKDARKSLEIFREYVNQNNPPIREMYVAETNKYVCVQFLTRGQESKLKKGKESNSEQLLGIIEEIAGIENIGSAQGIEVLKEICAPITLLDLPIIFPNQKFADMQYISVFKNFLLGKGFNVDEIEKMSIEEIVEEAKKTYNEGNVDFHASLLADTMVSGIDYLDLEKVLLLATVRPLESYELMSPKVESKEGFESEIIKNLSEQEEEKDKLLDSYIVEETPLEDVIKRTRRIEFIIRKILESKVIDKRTRVKYSTLNEEREVTLRRVEELMNKFCDGIYLSDTMQLALVYGAFSSENKMSETWSDELVKRIRLTDNDKYILSTVNFENLERLYSLGRMNKEHIKNLVQQAYNGALDANIEETLGGMDEEKKELMQQNNRNLLKNLYNSKIIDAKDLGEFFDLGIIDIEHLEQLEEDKSPEDIVKMHESLKNEFNTERLLSNYKNYVLKYNEFIKFQKEHPEETEKIEKLREEVNYLRTEKERFRKVFNKYNDIPENGKIDFADDLLTQYYIDFEVDEENLQESIKVLYEDGFIDLENIIHLDKSYIIPMLDRLSMKDVYRVRNSMSFEELEEMLDTIFDDPEFTDERKFIVVMNLLGEDTEEDKEARQFYLEMLDFNDGERKIKSQGKRQIKNPGVGGNDSTKYVYPDVIKWKFYKALDPDCRVTRYSNGFVEFASSKLGARIIEKYYDGNKQAYGTATYILPESEYRKNEADLVTILPKGNILESATLKDITPRKDRIAHRTQSVNKTWMDAMISYFKIDFEPGKETRYTDEELRELDSVRKNHKLDYEIIE